jgi:Tfp pilus assembly protein FimT
MSRSGFTTIEMIIVVILIGLITMIGFPRMRAALQKSNVRSTRVALAGLTSIARAAAVQRGCRAAVHFRTGASGVGRSWVTACPRTKAGAGTVDTLGGVEQLATRYSVTLTTTRDSVQFNPRGLNMDFLQTVVRVQGAIAEAKDSTVINQVGKVTR